METKWSIGMPRSLVMASIRCSGESFNAASILPTLPTIECGGIGTKRSRGMERTEAPWTGSRWSSIVTSLRAPPTSSEVPKCAASPGARPVRVLLPMSRIVMAADCPAARRPAESCPLCTSPGRCTFVTCDQR
jgi:hypothetical protein